MRQKRTIVDSCCRQCGIIKGATLGYLDGAGTTSFPGSGCFCLTSLGTTSERSLYWASPGDESTSSIADFGIARLAAKRTSGSGSSEAFFKAAATAGVVGANLPSVVTAAQRTSLLSSCSAASKSAVADLACGPSPPSATAAA